MPSLQKARCSEGDDALGVRVPTAHPSAVARKETWTGLVIALSGVRDWLLHAITTGQEVDETYFEWLSLAHQRLDAYYDRVAEVGSVLTEMQSSARSHLTPEQRHRYRYGDVPAPGSDAEWQAAERLAEAALRQMGFETATRTTAGADGGLDVLGPTIAAQVKYTAAPVGRPLLQQLQGAAAGRITVFFSRAGFTSTAVEYADYVGMALFRISLPTTIGPANQRARQMSATVD